MLGILIKENPFYGLFLQLKEIIKQATEVALHSRSIYAIINAIATYAGLFNIELKQFPVESRGIVKFCFTINNRKFKWY